MALANVTQYKLRKLLKYAAVTQAVALVLVLFSGEPLSWYMSSWALLGLWTGVLEEFLFGRRFRSLAIPLQFLGKALLVNLFSIGLIALVYAIDRGAYQPMPGGG